MLGWLIPRFVETTMNLIHFTRSRMWVVCWLGRKTTKNSITFLTNQNSITEANILESNCENRRGGRIRNLSAGSAPVERTTRLEQQGSVTRIHLPGPCHADGSPLHRRVCLDMCVRLTGPPSKDYAACVIYLWVGEWGFSVNIFGGTWVAECECVVFKMPIGIP